MAFQIIKSDDELLDILRNYYKDVGFPTQRKFKASSGLPAYSVYYERFGSFKNAILMAGIDIPDNRNRYFDRNSLSDEEMLKLLEFYTKEKLKNDIYLLDRNDVNNNKNLPHMSTFNSRFGGLIEAYKCIGIEYEEFNNNAFEKDMLLKYNNLKAILNRVPNSRDIDLASKNKICYSMNAYENHFGCLHNLQKICNFNLTVPGKGKSDSELLDDLINLKNNLGRYPTMRDIDCEPSMASAHLYCERFGSLNNALIQSGFNKKDLNKKIKITSQGTKCFSSYEYKFAKVLENNKLNFSQGGYYKDYISNFDKEYEFDFIIHMNNKTYFVEIFGIEGNETYDQRKQEKINICKQNGLLLLEFYPIEFWSTTQEQLYDILTDKISSINIIYKDVI